MYRPPKPNTPEEVKRRIEKLNETLDDVVELLASEKKRYDLKSHCIKNRLVYFLSEHGVNISISKKKIVLGKNSQPALNLAERIYRFADKIVLKYFEQRTPRPILYSVLDLFNPIDNSAEMIGMMSNLSDAMTFGQYKSIQTAILDDFPKIVRKYELEVKEAKKTVSPEIREEKVIGLNHVYQEGLKEYLGYLKKFSQITDEKVQKKKITEVRILLMNELESSQLDDNHISNHYNITPQEIAVFAQAEQGVSKFEEKHGDVVNIYFRRRMNISTNRTIDIHTIKNGTNTKIKVPYSKPGSRIDNQFLKALGEKAENRDFGGHTRFRRDTTRTLTALDKGYLTHK